MENNNYLGREGSFDDSKQTLREEEAKKLKNSMNCYEEDFLKEYKNEQGKK